MPSTGQSTPRGIHTGLWDSENAIAGIGFVGGCGNLHDEDAYRAALATAEDRHGPESEAMASALNDLGSVLAFRGDWDEALLVYLRALAAAERAVEWKPGDILFTVLHNIVLTLTRMGDPARAEHYARRALERACSLEVPDWWEVADASEQIASVLEQEGKLDEAVDLRRRVVEIRQELGGPDDPWTAFSKLVLASRLHHLGCEEESEATFRRALDTFYRMAPTVGDEDLPFHLIQAGRLLREEERYEDAASLLSRVLVVVEGNDVMEVRELTWLVQQLGADCSCMDNVAGADLSRLRMILVSEILFQVGELLALGRR